MVIEAPQPSGDKQDAAGHPELRDGRTYEDYEGVIKFCAWCITQDVIEARYPGRRVSSSMCDTHYERHRLSPG